MGDQNGAGMPRPTRVRDGVTILDIDRYAPFLLNAVSNAWVRKTAPIYRRDFDLGISDWRVLSMLNIEPEITANRICEALRLDKAAVSRSLKVLSERGLIDYEASSTDPRRRKWWLTEAGQEMHATLLEIALAHEERMRGSVSEEDFEAYLRVMHMMLRNIDS